jgi:hypothetical protein
MDSARSIPTRRPAPRSGPTHAPRQASPARPDAPVRDLTPPPVAAPPAAPNGSIIDRYPATPPVTITHEPVIVGEIADVLWDVYRANFEPLSQVAVMSQASTHAEMIEFFANPRVHKVVAWEDGTPVGLGMVTNDLDLVVEISPPYLRSRYPEHAARDAIYIGMYVLVAPHHRRRTLFSRLYLELWQIPALVGGLMVWDVCESNRQMLNMDRLAEKIASNFPRSSVGVLDRQTWYVAELPEAIPDLGRG